MPQSGASVPSFCFKNALDWVYPEWNRKAAAFVSYGSAMGARGVQQLRMTAIERPSMFLSRRFGRTSRVAM
jgi:NAD(P)H-dependent FMN reductase